MALPREIQPKTYFNPLAGVTNKKTDGTPFNPFNPFDWTRSVKTDNQQNTNNITVDKVFDELSTKYQNKASDPNFPITKFVNDYQQAGSPQTMGVPGEYVGGLDPTLMSKLNNPPAYAQQPVSTGPAWIKDYITAAPTPTYGDPRLDGSKTDSAIGSFYTQRTPGNTAETPGDFNEYLKNVGGYGAATQGYENPDLDFKHLMSEYQKKTEAPTQNIMDAYGNINKDISSLEELFRKATGAEFDAKDKGQSMLINELNKSASQRALEREAFENKAAANRIMTGSSRGMVEAQNMLAARDAEQAQQALMMEQLIEQKNLKGQRGASEAQNIVGAEQLSAERWAQEGKAETDAYMAKVQQYAAELGLEGMAYQSFVDAAARKYSDDMTNVNTRNQARSAENVANINASTERYNNELAQATTRYNSDEWNKIQKYATDSQWNVSEMANIVNLAANGKLNEAQFNSFLTQIGFEVPKK